MTAELLSQQLYGDGAHKVTVRAEISRMRRALGALVATNPYRVGDGRDIEVSGGQSTGRRLTFEQTEDGYVVPQPDLTEPAERQDAEDGDAAR